jgi:hypothetical protein
VDPVVVYLSSPLRRGGALPVRLHLRPICPLHTPNDWCPVLMRLIAPVEGRSEWRFYDFIEDMPLDNALAWPVVGEA